jgi:hypothetical protein
MKKKSLERRKVAALERLVDVMEELNENFVSILAPHVLNGPGEAAVRVSVTGRVYTQEIKEEE